MACIVIFATQKSHHNVFNDHYLLQCAPPKKMMVYVFKTCFLILWSNVKPYGSSNGPIIVILYVKGVVVLNTN